jgi:predicted secreted protein
MARLEIASASAGVGSGASDAEGGWVEPLKGKGSESPVMAASLLVEDAMSSSIESGIRYSELEICERGRVGC